MTTARSPVSAKVSNGTLLGFATGLLTGALEYFVPAFHQGVPAPLQTLLSAAVGAAGYFGGGWLSAHKATAAEIEAAVAELETISKAVAAHPVADVGSST